MANIVHFQKIVFSLKTYQWYIFADLAMTDYM